MAHKGRTYPFAPRRDLSICSTPMMWLPRKRIIFGNSIRGFGPWSTLPGQYISREVELDAEEGVYVWEWDEVLVEGFRWRWKHEYRLTFDEHEARIQAWIWINDIEKTSFRVGPFTRLDLVGPGTITYATEFAFYIDWQQAVSSAASWLFT